MALADQAAGIRHGFANPALYTLAGSSAFRDIVYPALPMAAVRTDFANSVNPHDGLAFTLRSLNQTGTLDTTPGYDDVTGSNRRTDSPS